MARRCVAALVGLLASTGALAQIPPHLGATRGVAPGYLDDQICATCHDDLAASFREVAMSQALLAPKTARPIEDFSALPFYHAASRQYFALFWHDDQLFFRSFVRKKGREQDPSADHAVFEVEVRWILGSGNHARTYLARAPNGELFQLPLAFYGQTKTWGMAPGYDRADHAGPTRLVRRECLFCHGAYPELPEGADSRMAATHAMPEDLPAGIGCQRCHGPGAAHVELAAGGIGAPEEIRAAIVNPARLGASQQRDVCYQCHYQPSVAIAGMRRLGRRDFSFRPGQNLADYLVPLQVEQEGVVAADRFEINHHPFRLEQSRCFIASGGALACTSCHDPHRKLPAEARAAHYRQVCLGCHGAPGATATPGRTTCDDPAAIEGDCVACHLPARRPADVVQVLMTDHKITRRPAAHWTAPRAEEEPVLTELHVMGEVAAEEAELYRALAAVRADAQIPGALDVLARALHRLKPQFPEPYLDLLDGLLATRRLEDARPVLTAVLARWPEEAALRERQALFLAAENPAAAVASLERLRAEGWERPELDYNLGLLQRRLGRLDAARDSLARAVAARPFFSSAWLVLSKVEADRGQKLAASEALARAKALAPGSLPD